jgi:SAM-dependent methyltransferase
MKVLNLGCGKNKLDGTSPGDEVIGLDIEKLPGIDVVWNLEKTPMPFKDGEFDIVICNYVLEQIQNFFPLMKEIHRIVKLGGLVKIKVAFYSSWSQYNDPLHVRSFSYYSFNRFDPSHTRHYRKEYYGVYFKIRKRRFNFAVGSTKILNPIINPIVNAYPRFYSRFLAWILPCVDLEFELESIK